MSDSDGSQYGLPSFSSVTKAVLQDSTARVSIPVAYESLADSECPISSPTEHISISGALSGTKLLSKDRTVTFFESGLLVLFLISVGLGNNLCFHEYLDTWEVILELYDATIPGLNHPTWAKHHMIRLNRLKIWGIVGIKSLSYTPSLDYPKYRSMITQVGWGIATVGVMLGM